MEEYLKTEYEVIEDLKLLTSEEDIVPYFEDNGRDFLDCGQGYYEDQTSIICKVGEKFYEVYITGEIGSSKQDVGDRLYWIEKIEDVEYKEIPKPVESPKDEYSYTLKMNETQKKSLEAFLKEFGIKVV